MSLGALVLAASGLTGCALLEGDEGEAATAPSSQAPVPPPAENAPANGAGTGGGGGQATPPGSTLKVGERAVVPFEYGSRTGTIGITVTAIEQGDQSAFAARFGSKAQGLTPYYIRYQIENVGGTDLSNSSAPLLGAMGENGRSTGIGVIGEVDGCERGRADETFTSAGARFQGCRLQAARAGSPVTGAKYDETDGGYRDRPIVWSR